MRQAARTRAAKSRDTALYVSGARNKELIAHLEKMSGPDLARAIQSNQLSAAPMAPNRENALQILGAAQALVNERVDVRTRRALGNAESPLV